MFANTGWTVEGGLLFTLSFGAITRSLDSCNRLLTVGQGKPSKAIVDSLAVFGVLGQLKSKALKRSGFGDDYIESQIKERALARKNKDFSRGDKIRSHLAAKGIALMDVGTETGWRSCVPVQQEQPSGPEHAKPCVETEKE